MKTNIILSAIAAVVLSVVSSFSAKAAESGSDVEANSSASTSYVLDRSDYVKANTTDVWTVTLKAGVRYTVRVCGDGDTDLDLFVYDENGNLIDSDDDSLDLCYCHVTPKWTGTFKIKVKNLGDVYNDYDIQVYSN